MSESVQVSERFHEFLESRRREDETMEETLRRLVGRPERDDVRPTSDDAESPQDDASSTHRVERSTQDDAERNRNALTGPHPSEVAGIISSKTAEKMRERIERGGERDAAARRELMERFE